MSNDTTLNLLVSDLLSYVRTSVDVADYSDLSLLVVGDRLASEVAQIYKASMQDYDFRDITSKFYFDRKKFEEEPEYAESSSDLPDSEFKREVFVGYQAEASSLLQQLVSITKKRLQVISIVGMAGLGKTTLARRLYNDPYVVSYFYVRAWVTCSQIYHKRNLLLGILRSVAEVTDDVYQMDDNMLAHHLYRALMGRRYLIVIDDIWSREAWDDFKNCFPDDKNGSRIMLTTRLKVIASHAQSDGDPLCLRFLTEDESFELFRRKTFIRGAYFSDLSSIGHGITKKCHGLPLAIVVIAGLLKDNLDRDWWIHVAKSVRSYIVTDENQYIETLALSYNHLPQHLRPCFLSFGAFPEDYGISVRKLIYLWIAEGFIHLDGTQKTLEDVAEDHLTDLISRSLVVVGKKGSNGAMKTCYIHDLLRELCVRKAKEENFSLNISNYNKHSYPCSHSSNDPCRESQLLLSPNVPGIPSICLCYSTELSVKFFDGVSIVWETSKVIRALDLSSLKFSVFPIALVQLVHLRYLELRFRTGNLPESICRLQELQTLIMTSRMNMVVPKYIWKMINLRHLCIKTGENPIDFSNVEEEPSFLENLQSLSLVSPASPCQHILAKTKNLRKLGLCGTLTTRSGEFKCPDLGLLMHLETLKLLNTTPFCKAGRLSNSIAFPGSLKKLTVSNTYLDWKEAWVFEVMPNLEVLKLKSHAFFGDCWEPSPEAFPCLKFLKLEELDIVTWTASRNHFPVLEHLQVIGCLLLMEIPEDFGNICTLEWIEVSGCSNAVTSSVREIQKEQKSYGNDLLHIRIR
ncbi:hypothetical protein DCAR_0311552 [Daucus carota subsp. sativus]|uniref:NB-ARC domain-containing protein n=1 Tax=Daucus carota subsp. sativus TaxID=79200 RepID=A0AAF0WNB9_DAUCS|nr:PREDICTED: putative late blight resistance protein homolog R1A-10 [Daucus carota subsp. sativus]WOG92289.1 hypothetical protein DCAR_0311552 [Daucus carota subsp. sativus]